MREALGVDVSRETSDRLERYLELLEKWTSRINLVAPGTIRSAWRRHFVDSAQLWHLRPPRARSWVDIGSGAGFPGLVVAILAKELDPDLAVTLVESDARKAAFLRAVMRETSVEARLEVARAERIAPQGADVLSARALAPLDRLLALAERHLGQKGVALFPKGANAETEIEAALARWSFRCEKHPSRTDAKAVILKIGEPIRG